MSKTTFITIFILGIVASLIFYFYPQIDLTISSFLYNSQQGFFLVAHPNRIINFFRFAIVVLSYIIVISMIIVLVIKWLRPKIFSQIPARTAIFIILSFTIPSLLVVESVLKEHWGRARPSQITQFGGDSQFTPAWEITEQCESNCSFSSGEAANAFAYIALIFIAGKRRRTVAVVVLTVASLVGLMRMAQGGHFFSDVIISAWIEYIMIWLFYQWYLLKRPNKSFLLFRGD